MAAKTFRARGSKAWHIQHDLNCETKGIVYCGFCTEHDVYYVGQTSGNIKDRFTTHKSGIKSQKDNTITRACGLTRHFRDKHTYEKLPPNVDNDLNEQPFCSLKFVLLAKANKPEKLGYLEQKIMLHLETHRYSPHGLNNNMDIEKGRRTALPSRTQDDAAATERNEDGIAAAAAPNT